ncbi:TetR/AcrR family transcriptional regulator [Streptomyces sp. NPDC101234]|uniref:TetR/AcrR family transcriptional regulator n=1 Tax=Streptomyces sp. NPDC101234 TaxID=3366138 RepID=UPI00381B1C8B
MTFQRARNEEQREIRRQAIMETALAMLDEMPVAEMSLNELSRRVGLAKSNVLRYFESREAVLLELLERALETWLEEVSGELSGGVDPQLPAAERGDQVAAILARSLARHGLLCDLVGAQAGVLEHNVSVDVVVRYKRSSIASLGTMADLVRLHVPELGPGAGTVAVLTLILAGALWAQSRPSASAIAAYEADPTLALLRLDLPTTLENTLATLITGTLVRSGS